MSRTLFSSLKTQFTRVGVQSNTSQLLSGSIAASSKQPIQTSPILTFVRYATKRAAGSKTSNKDSRGRRLGSKKSDGMC